MTRGIVAGCFDILHPGYIELFREAKKYCQHLTIALHADPSKDRKTKLKPVIPIEFRQKSLEALRDVDQVILYDTEQQLYSILKSGLYDARFLGTDYLEKDFTGSDLALQIIWIDRSSHQYSTTQIKYMIASSILDSEHHRPIFEETRELCKPKQQN